MIFVAAFIIGGALYCAAKWIGLGVADVLEERPNKRRVQGRLPHDDSSTT